MQKNLPYYLFNPRPQFSLLCLLRLITNDHKEPHGCESLENFQKKTVDSFDLPQNF